MLVYTCHFVFDRFELDKMVQILGKDKRALGHLTQQQTYTSERNKFGFKENGKDSTVCRFEKKDPPAFNSFLFLIMFCFKPDFPPCHLF